MVLTMEDKHDKQVLVFRHEGFQLPAPSRCEEIIENASKTVVFSKIISAQQELMKEVITMLCATLLC